MDRVHAQEARRILDRVVGYPLSNLLGKKVARGLQRRPRAVRRPAAGRRPRARDRGVQAGGILEDHGAAGAGRDACRFRPSRCPSFAPRSKARRPTPRKPRRRGAAKGTRRKRPPPKMPPRDVPGRAGRVGRRRSSSRSTRPRPMTVGAAARHRTLRRDEGRAEGPRREGAAAVHHQHAAAAGEHPAALHGPADHADGPEAVRRRRSRQRRLGGAHHLHAYRQHARLQRGAAPRCATHIDANFGEPYLPEKPNFFASGKSAQEAHEAIRPTDLAYTPERVARLGLHGDQLRLYTLIYQRFVASQMTPAIFAVTNVEVTATPTGPQSAGVGLFKARARC